MSQHKKVTAKFIFTQLMPKLRTIEFVIETKLENLILTAPSSTRRQQVEKLKNEFELELMMIKLNLEHLLKRYKDVLKLDNLEEDDTLLELDDKEKVAIESAWKLYRNLDKVAGHFNISI